MILLTLAVLLLATPAHAQDRTRVDLFDAQSRRTGYAIIDRESRRVDYFDAQSRRTGYGKVDDTGRAERFDTQGRRVPGTVVPPGTKKR